MGRRIKINKRCKRPGGKCLVWSPGRQPPNVRYSFARRRVMGKANNISPPVKDKLLAWLPDRNADSDEKREVISGFNFFYNNCPLLFEYDPNGDPVLDPNGDPVSVGTDTGTVDTGWWPCEYRAPDTGEPGYTELLANDNGELYTAEVANTLTYATFVNSAQVFWCEHTGKGIAVYLPLDAGELAEVQEFFGCL